MQSALDRLLFRTLAEAYVQQLTSFGWDDNGNNLIKMYAQPNQNQNVPHLKFLNGGSRLL